MAIMRLLTRAGTLLASPPAPALSPEAKGLGFLCFALCAALALPPEPSADFALFFLRHFRHYCWKSDQHRNHLERQVLRLTIIQTHHMHLERVFCSI